MAVRVYYIVQGEAGEEMSHPNVFSLPNDTPGSKKKKIQLKSILGHFPLRGTGNFHFRFKLSTNTVKNGFSWVDVNDPNAIVPFYKGMLLAKLLRLDRPFYSGKQRNKEDWTIDASRSSKGRKSTKRNATSRDMKSTSATNNNKTRNNKSDHHGIKKKTVVNTYTTKIKNDNRNVTKSKRNKSERKKPERRPSDGDMLKFEESVDTTNNHDIMDFDTFTTSNGTSQSMQVKPKNVIREDMSDEVKDLIRQRQREEQKRIDKAHEIHLQKKKQEIQNQLDRETVKGELQEKLLAWSGDINKGTLKNIRALLTTMDSVLWEGSGWKTVTLADWVQSSKVKIKYYKAIRMLHPDRSQKAEPRQKYISEQIFTALNAAWDKFQRTEIG